MKTLFKIIFLSFAVLFFFLLNPDNIFTASVVENLLWVSGTVLFICFLFLPKVLLNKDKQIIELKNKISLHLKEDNETIAFLENENSELKERLNLFKLPGDLIQIPEQVFIDFKYQLALCEERNKDLRLQLEDLSSSYRNLVNENRVLSNSGNWLRVGLTGEIPEGVELPYGAPK